MRSLVLLLALASTTVAQGTPLPPVPVPPENPMTTDKVNLGKALFWDEQLSSSQTVACATCHIPEAGGSDPRAPRALHPGPDDQFATDDDILGSFGVISTSPRHLYQWHPLFGMRAQVTHRKAPSVFMAAYDRELFWDGRAPDQLFDPITRQLVIPQGAALERQATIPILSEVEMTHSGTDWPDIIARVQSSVPLGLARRVPPALSRWLRRDSYPALFARTFGTPDVTPVRIAMAIASYQRALVPNQTPFDSYVAGNQQALTAQEQSGLAVFERVRCSVCHPAPLFTTGEFFTIGVRPPDEDVGRGGITRDPIDRGAFKVPSLRNVADRAPYMHNGRLPTLEAVVDFYERGGDFAENRTPIMRPARFNGTDKADLLAFLRRPLTDPRASAGAAPFDHPELSAEDRRAPRAYGQGTAGTLGRTPQIVAVEPPVLGNGHFRMSLTDGFATAPAVLLLDGAAGNHRLLGVRFHVAFTASLVLLPLGQLLHGSGAGDGWASWSFALPRDPALAGSEFFAQAIVLDAGGPQGLSASAGVRWRLFAAR
jgi:cytochrome c peroxidase